MRKPNLFIVGHARSGTTSLYQYLKQHPEIFMSPDKEPTFFCSDYHRFPYLNINNIEEYLSLFKNAGNEKIVGEASVWYLPSLTAAKNIWQFNPEAKIIMMFREPVDFLYSDYYYQRSLLKYKSDRFLPVETMEDFENAVLQSSSTNSNPVSAIPYLDMIKYTEQINRFLKYFRRERIKMIIFDDFVKETREVYKDILGFLAVDTSFKPYFKIYNPRRKLRLFAPVIMRLHQDIVIDKTRFKILGKTIKNIISVRVRRRLLDMMFSCFMFKRQTRQELSPEVIHRLKPLFKDEVIKLSRFLGRDLVTEWGYD